MGPAKHVRSFPRQSHWRKRLSQIMQSSSEAIPQEDINVGRRLQELRIIQGLSQRELAEMSGLNFNTLSLIETEKTSPNVSTLHQLAAALNVPITAFFESIVPPQKVIFQKPGHRPQTRFPQGEFEDLGGGLALGEGTPLLMTLCPHTESDPESIVHTGQEFVYCLTGQMAFWVDGVLYPLEPGDSLIFEAHLPHRWENQGDAEARAILVICPADRDDRSVMQHIL